MQVVLTMFKWWFMKVERQPPIEFKEMWWLISWQNERDKLDS